jgi:DNA-binding Lrp family transcriptional regulator
VQPLFVVAGEGVREEVPSMPGVERLSITEVVAEATELQAAGIGAVILFGIPSEKDEAGSGAYDPEGVVQLAVRALKEAHPDLVVITDVCLCEYTSHGHCGVVRDGEVDNDITIELLAKTAISHADAGADAVAPSDPPRGGGPHPHLLRQRGSGMAVTPTGGASAEPAARPKVRSRKGGAAVPLDTADKHLMNLLQSSFPLAREPFAALATAAEMPADEVKARTQRLLDERIIRELTPIFDTRALGYASMLVAARVDPDNPHRAARIINSHPGVSHNYLRTHQFNLWFTIATPPESKLGLEGTLEVLQRETGAESIRQLPTLTLFKINMNLEMERGTDALAAAVDAAPPRELERQPYDDVDIAVIRALQGPMAVVDRPYDDAAREVGMDVDAFLAHLEGMVERRLLRRVAAILFHRRAGFSANGMGVWRVPEERILEVGRRMAAVRGISHCYQRPTYPDWPYSVFTMAHGRSKAECDAILDGIAAEHDLHGEDRAVLYSSTEFKKVRLHYFTEEYARWEAEHGGV